MNLTILSQAIPCHSSTHMGWMLTSLHKKIQTLEDFQLNKKNSNSLAVVNDRAERVVKLMQNCNSSIRISEEQKHYLLLVAGCLKPQSQVPRSCCLLVMIYRSIRAWQLRTLMASDWLFKKNCYIDFALSFVKSIVLINFWQYLFDILS